MIATSAPSLRPGRPRDDAIFALLAMMAHCDGTLADEELEMMQAVLPGRSIPALRQWIAQVGATSVDFHTIRQVLDTDDRRWIALQFCARMATRDNHLHDREVALMQRIARELQLPEGAVDKVLQQRRARDAGRYERQALLHALKNGPWGAARIVPGSIASADLKACVPESSVPVARVGVDRTEVMGLYEEGVVARFLEGTDFLHWHHIVGCSHGSGLAASLKIHTDDGRTRHLADARLSGLRMLIEGMGTTGDGEE